MNLLFRNQRGVGKIDVNGSETVLDIINKCLPEFAWEPRWAAKTAGYIKEAGVYITRKGKRPREDERIENIYAKLESLNLKEGDWISFVLPCKSYVQG